MTAMNGPERLSFATPAPGAPADGAGQAQQSQAKKLAQEFEALLITQMLRDMREALVDETEDDAASTDFGALAGTIDSEFGRAMASVGGFGLATTLVEAIGRLTAETAAPPVGEPSIAPSETVSGAGAATDLAARTITSGFGWRSDPLTGSPRFHSGIDVRMAYGEDVRSVAAGRVRLAGDAGGYGNMVAIVHQDGTETRYAHLAEMVVREGDAVGAGQVVGRSGSSGRVTGPHLHFEVLLDGRRVDPAAARFGTESTETRE